MTRSGVPGHGSSLTGALAGIVAGVLGLAPHIAAAQATQPDPLALTVQPREMATVTRNPPVGEYVLEEFPWYTVSVPPQCAGARRCPLFLFLPGAGQSASTITGWLRPVADRYGLMLLAASDGKYHPLAVDLALKATLQHFAIDPAKIAIVGRCASVGSAIDIGSHNLHVFSRIAAISPGGIPDLRSLDPANTTVEFLADDGFGEASLPFHALIVPNAFRQRVRSVWTIRAHEHQAEDYDLLGRWLAESWAKPPAERTAPMLSDPLPVLTPEAIAKLTTFWTSFFKEPEWIRVTARRIFMRDFAVPSEALVPPANAQDEHFGEIRPVIPMTDMAAFAAQYPSVAAALKQAGLTGRQHDAYRLALLTAWVAGTGAKQGIQLPSGTPSVLAKNVAFLIEHADAVETLTRVGIEDFGGPFYTDGWQCCVSPKSADELRPLGIFRTP